MSRLIRRSHPLQILSLAEDANQQRAVEAGCQLINANPTFAECGAQAVKLFRTLMIDVVLLDMNLRAGDGFETLSKIRLSGRRGYNAPVIAVAENITGLPEAAYRKLGFSALCLKPIDPFRLVDRVDAALIAAGQTPLFMMRVSG
ncbi:MAG TPA: response regulator [Rhizomicrobium sp.]|nr:response regulator [Rhizomicrobium sp.]